MIQNRLETSCRRAADFPRIAAERNEVSTNLTYARVRARGGGRVIRLFNRVISDNAITARMAAGQLRERPGFLWAFYETEKIQPIR